MSATASFAHAGMALTTAGSTAGFGLSTFSDTYPNSSTIGPLGIAFRADGKVMVSDFPGNVRVLNDVDGQDASSVTPASNYGTAGAVGLTNLGGTIYMASQSSASVYSMAFDGSSRSFLAGVATATGITNDGTDLFVSGSFAGTGFIDKVTTAGVVTTFQTGGFDGLSVDVGAGIIYASASSIGHVLGFRISDGAQVFDSGAISGGIDGVAIGQGTLAGNLFVNTNGGTLVEVDMTSLAQTVVADGGSRGDFVTVDPNGTLLLTQTDSVLRLTAPEGASFGSDAPEPGTIATMLAGLGALALARRRNRA